MNVFEMELKRDRNGRIVEKTETVAGTPATWKYTYDNGGRLTEAHRDGRLICQCHYDGEGRRSRDYFPATVGPHYRDYQYTMDNRLLRAGNNTYTHDDNGFRSIWSNGGTYHLYEYTPDYRLLRMEVEDQNRVYTFQHDDDGQRVAKYLNGQLAEAYQWLDFIRLGAFHDGRMGYEFDYTDKERLPSSMRREDGAEFTLYYDQVGSLRVVADSHGNVIKEVLYDPFGGIIEDTNPDFRIPIGFAGGLHDRDLGFVRFGWRDYDVNTGRWTAPDPIGDKGGDPDWYGYCLDDPVNGNDPLGLEGGFWSGMKSIGTGLGQLWNKAPKGIGEAITKGSKGAEEALSKTANAFATNKDLQKYTGIALGAGMLPIAAAGAIETAPIIAGAAMQHPDKLAAASKAAVDFANGLVEGPPPQSPAGGAGALTKGVYDWYKQNRR
ncbi:RHS repeat-associated core domain-containing protein [Pseudodesulfovibrio thermohalotolerans]|uniref:RHS repeat domain-containing protein n=1 Tax=Pseudodesulfovibrio thermohalotolerans TaxID=2880651 RepID=UPI00244354B1|nr:RHS repeat-associated core domain-containing protein [Pseudodesulfovibrio thermohalotolerans]WFS64220.1 RHS repeat-associated core domain-containing protein [Pseudodesulfovibrio thermohalotolerans]